MAIKVLSIVLILLISLYMYSIREIHRNDKRWLILGVVLPFISCYIVSISQTLYIAGVSLQLIVMGWFFITYMYMLLFPHKIHLDRTRDM